MKVRTKTIRGTANAIGSVFESELKKFIESKLSGFTYLPTNESIRGKNATEKVIIKAKYWRGEWIGLITEVHSIYYK